MTVRVIPSTEKETMEDIAERYPFHGWDDACDQYFSVSSVGLPDGAFFSAGSCNRPAGHAGPHVAYVKCSAGTSRSGYTDKQPCAYWFGERED